MALILQIETATTSCSVAIAKDGIILAYKEANERNTHAEVITRFVEHVINEAGVTYQQLDAIAVSCGPGSYTGLRIGISTVKGLCYALDKPLIAIETLAAMSDGAKRNREYNDDMLLCPMIDARRMEVFTAVFNSDGEKVEATSALIIDENSFSNLLVDKKVLFFGDGAEKCQSVLSSNSNAIFLNGFINSAVHLSERTLEKFVNREFEDVAYFEPYYLKEFIAGKKAL
ncbi:tRNA threonylcarbamoyladenosine biosynthesis protein TsaB [Mucilaginibacter frigoritolerans]|uniref:tRNA threonylcarbamoyladenosine biosynthesis protein TsaB n=1 Tax=Mucilaginibacter frigoritolerans TaxID=652788 RepID=A0A562TS67_9SPHI|nr:tRNA (adenosine(37)-N6)-threonylcarbamoyltransferase complex dimerization subunit type 1 TsaB [Mucilaginibacter frigoritolerans]TWI96283.1 tRNA threonylcarbamoyladenosine biosynthesis protein TsaB [Mucilaginibacter frigoritolerans]